MREITILYKACGVSEENRTKLKSEHITENDASTSTTIPKHYYCELRWHAEWERDGLCSESRHVGKRMWVRVFVSVLHQLHRYD